MNWALPLLLAGFLAGCGGGKTGNRTLFRELPASESGVVFSNQLETDGAFNIVEYLYYYNGGGVAAGDVNNDSLPDLYFTSNQGSNALYINRGGFRFEDVTGKAGVAGAGGWTTGVTMADVNADGRLDIYVCHLGDYKGIRGHNELFLNQGDGTFREAAAEFGLDFRGFSTQAAFFDFDRDGDLDCYLLNHSVHSTENFGNAGMRATRDSLAGDRLLRNEGGRFRDVSAQVGIYGSRIGYGLGIATGDLNNDGWPDIYVSNDFHENDYLYYNNGDGSFREAVTRSIRHTSTFSMGSDIADFDNDGRLDLISLDMKPADETVLKSSVGSDPYNIYRYKLGFGYHYQYPRNMLQWNRGNLQGREASFSEIGQLAGVDATDWSWSPLFCDLDGDGYKDLFISNGIWQRPNDLDYLRYISNQQIQARASDEELISHMPEGKVRNFAFRNMGDLRFENMTAPWGLDFEGCSNGAAYADLDGDGDLDLALNNLNQVAGIFENQAAADENYRYLRVRLQGKEGNPFGTGARVEIEAGGRRQVQELYPTRGFQSAVEPVLIFGLGQAGKVDRLRVRWATGEVQELMDIKANATIVVDQRKGKTTGEDISGRPEKTGPLFARAAGASGLDFIHRENNFLDFDGDGLMPHMLSTQGPRMAVGDADADGRPDLYVCGARGQSGGLYLQSADGRFHKGALQTPEGKEEVDACFLDADNDGDQDLYIVSGGGELTGNLEDQRDQLWFNDGSGNFTPAGGETLPPVVHNGACVVPLDYDGDGAFDLFLGGRSRPGNYGLPAQSYLLHNDGHGHFRDVTQELAPDLKNLGMVTDACLLSGEKEQRLVVVGEWMPVTLFTLSKGKWSKQEIGYSNGWWNRVEAADLDGDGDGDLLLGNLGLNADLRASRQEPVELYAADFDQNFQSDPLLTYYKQGRRYSYAGFDELTRQLVILRKDYTNYRDFAARNFDEVFPESFLENAVHRLAYTFASATAINQGGGNFELRSLPVECQIAPLYGFAAADFDGDGIMDALAVGNFYDSRPSLGRYDASFGHFLRGKGDGTFEAVAPDQSGFVVEGQARDIRLVPTAKHGNPLLIVAGNNTPLQVFKMLPQ